MRKLAHKFLFLFCAIVFCYVLCSKDDSYSFLFKIITCKTRETCFHESAHKYDDISGMISNSNEWVEAVDNYRMLQFYLPQEYRDDGAFGIMFFPGIGSNRLPDYNIFHNSFWQGGWGGYTELYAHLVECSGGDINNIPLMLQKYYDMAEINETVKGLGY